MTLADLSCRLLNGKMNYMRGRVAPSLVLACSLVLVLPQGWCCLFALPMAKEAPPAATPDTTAPSKPVPRCPCCAQNTDTNPIDKSTPTNKPSAPPMKGCPCPERQAVVPTPSSVQHVDTGFVLLLPPLDIVPSSFALVEGSVGPVFHPLTHQLHVFNCLWLC
jgi:hypothetical protein